MFHVPRLITRKFEFPWIQMPHVISKRLPVFKHLKQKKIQLLIWRLQQEKTSNSNHRKKEEHIYILPVGCRVWVQLAPKHHGMHQFAGIDFNFHSKSTNRDRLVIQSMLGWIRYICFHCLFILFFWVLIILSHVM